MFGFIKKVLFTAMAFFSFNGLNAIPSNLNSLECLSMNNQECRTKTKIIDTNNNEPVLSFNNCSGNCNNINDPCAKLCVPDVGKNILVKVFNLKSWSNQTRHIEWHETCKCKGRLDSSVCSNKQRWTEDK